MRNVKREIQEREKLCKTFKSENNLKVCSNTNTNTNTTQYKFKWKFKRFPKKQLKGKKKNKFLQERQKIATISNTKFETNLKQLRFCQPKL